MPGHPFAGLVLYNLCVQGKVRATRTKAPYANTNVEARGAGGGGEQSSCQNTSNLSLQVTFLGLRS